MFRVLTFVVLGVAMSFMWDLMFQAPKVETPGETRYLSLSEPPKSMESLFAECRRENNVPVIGPGSTVVCVKRNVVAWEH